MFIHMSIFWWIIIGVVVLIVFMMVRGSMKIHKSIKQTNPETVVELIKDKKDSDNFGLSIYSNNKVWLQINEHQRLPLASTVQIIIAIAFAEQAANKQLDPNQQIELHKLKQLNIDKTDGGAFEKWLHSLSIDQETKHVPLIEVAKGMIEFSVNANTDFLMDIIGLDYINAIPARLELEKHDPIFPIISSMFIPVQFMKKDKLTEQATIKKINEIEGETYRQMAIDIYYKWQENPLTASEKRNVMKTLTMPIQRAWAKKLPHATTAGYASLMDKINSKSYFTKEIHQYLDPLLEYIMNKEVYQESFLYGGQKAGTTAFSVTMAMYATDKEHNQTSIAFFATQLNAIEQMKLAYSLNAFKRKLLTDTDFRHFVKESLTDEES